MGLYPKQRNTCFTPKQVRAEIKRSTQTRRGRESPQRKPLQKARISPFASFLAFLSVFALNPYTLCLGYKPVFLKSRYTRIRITKLMINFKSSNVYGLGVLKVSVLYRLTCLRIFKAKINRRLSNNKKCHNHYNLLAFMCL
jgi:hypothetical protein